MGAHTPNPRLKGQNLLMTPKPSGLGVGQGPDPCPAGGVWQGKGSASPQRAPLSCPAPLLRLSAQPPGSPLNFSLEAAIDFS